MPSRIRLLSTLVLLAPVIAAACGGDDDTGTKDSGAGAGTGGSKQAEAGTGGSVAQAGMGGSGGVQGGRGGAGGSAGGMDACMPYGGNGQISNAKAVAEPFDGACDKFYCPPTIAAAAEATLKLCNNTSPPSITYGCGTVTIDYADFSGGTSYTFDSKTGAVIGIVDSSDEPFGACGANYYFYGDFGQSCPDYVTCRPCDDLRNDAKNAAGAAGAAGDVGVAGAAGSTGEMGSAGAAGEGGAGSVPLAHCPKF